MTLKRNIIANYASQAYVTVVGIAMVPVYMGYMGAEAYGLVGVFAMLQALFQLLDIGLSPTLAREAARLNGGGCTAIEFRRLLRVLEAIFAAVALVGTALLIGGADFLARGWLRVETLPLDAVSFAISLMAVAVGLRWVSGLYRGILAGLERQVWLGKVNIFVATARFVLVIPVFEYIGTQPTHFFVYQLLVALAELGILICGAYHYLPRHAHNEHVGWHWRTLAGSLKFALSVAFTGAIWVLVTQLDKLLLSKILPLSQYGYFTVAVLVAGGVNIVSGPISAALIPRLTKLQAMGDTAGLERLYRTSTQLVVAVAASVSLMLAAFPTQILWAWTGDPRLAQQAAPVLSLYALGNGVLAVAAFPYYLQYAKGNLRLHLAGNVVYLVALVPALAWAAIKFGAVGAGWVWLTSNLAYFVLWIPLVHRRFLITPHAHWLGRDVVCPAFLSVAVAWFLHSTVPWPAGRIGTAVTLLVCAALLCAITFMAVAQVRAAASRQLTRYFVLLF